MIFCIRRIKTRTEIKKTKPKSGYLINSNLFEINMYKINEKLKTKIKYAEGTGFEKKAKPKKIGIKNKYFKLIFKPK